MKFSVLISNNICSIQILTLKTMHSIYLLFFIFYFMYGSELERPAGNLHVPLLYKPETISYSHFWYTRVFFDTETPQASSLLRYFFKTQQKLLFLLKISICNLNPKKPKNTIQIILVIMNISYRKKKYSVSKKIYHFFTVTKFICIYSKFTRLDKK